MNNVEKELRWWLHFLGGRAVVVLFFYKDTFRKMIEQEKQGKDG